MNIFTIAQQTFTEARRNKIFYSVFLFALVVLLNAVIFTEVTITTVDRMILDSGVAAINVFAIALTVFIGVGVINREVDRRSLYAIIVKPVRRWEFIVGKYLGLLAIMLSTCGLMLVGLMISLVNFKTDITSGLFVGFLGIVLEVMILGALALLCSSFTNSFVSGFITAAVFISGHLSAELKFSVMKPGTSEFQKVMGWCIYYLTPNLERFNFKLNVIYNYPVGADYLAMTVVYALLYVTAFLTAAVVVFSRRDFK
ncbi:MAG: ABC transporter permease [Myxococcaceae bacterium]